MLNKALARLHGLSPAVKASVSFAVCSILQKCISLITVPLFTRILTTEQYGQFTLYQSWLGLVMIFATLYLYFGVFNNGMTKYKQDRDRYLASMQGLSTVTTALVFCLYAVNMEFWENLFELPRIVILGMFAELLFGPALQYWSARQRYEFRYKALSLVTLGIAAANPLLGLAAVTLTEDKGVARCLSVSLLNAVVGLVFYCLNFARGRTFFVGNYWKFALAFNIPLIPHYLSQMVLSQSDRLMIGKLFGETPVAIYGLACTLGLVMTFVTNSINNSFVPWTYQECARGAYANIGRKASGLIFLVGGIALVPVVAAPELVALMGPAAYGEAVWLIPPLALSNYLIFLYSLFANIEFYFAESKFVMVASCLAAVSNLVLNFLFMPLFGYQAAAYTTVACYLLLAVAHYRFMRYIAAKNGVTVRIYRIRTMAAATAVLAGMMVVLQLLYPWPAARYGLVAVVLAAAVYRRRTLVDFLRSISKRGES